MTTVLIRATVLASCALAIAVCTASVAFAQPGAFAAKPKTAKQVAAALKKLPPLTRASRLSPPPSRDCPAEAPDCLNLPGVVTEEALLKWAFNDLNGLWSEVWASVGMPFASPKLRVLKGTQKGTFCGEAWTSTTPNAMYCFPATTIVWPFKGVHRVIGNLGPNWRDFDFALSIVLAHEYGHHLQNGTTLAGTGPKSWELRADCLAGLWGYTAWSRSIVEQSDIKEAVNLMIAVGDPPGTTGTDPNAHGTAQERAEAFGRGYQTGDISVCLEIP